MTSPVIRSRIKWCDFSHRRVKSLMKKKKLLINGFILIALICITFYFVLKDQEFDKLLQYMSEAKPFWLLVGLMMMLVFVSFESVIIHYLMKSLSYAVSFINCLKYSFIGFFVSAITPSATGGQPAQMYYMKSDDVPLTVSSLVLMIVTVVYKAVLLFLAAVMLIINSAFVMKHIKGIEIIMIFGIVVNVFMIGIILMLVFKQSFAKKLVCSCVLWLGRHRVIKNYQHMIKKILAAISKYDQSAMYLKTHKKIIFNVFILTTVQRLSLFAITWAIYKSFGLSGVSALEIITLQLIISMAVDNLPLPGGLGVSEGIFLLFFEEIFTSVYLTAGLILSRGFNYYAIIIVGGLVTVIAQLTRKRQT